MELPAGGRGTITGCHLHNNYNYTTTTTHTSGKTVRHTVTLLLHISVSDGCFHLKWEMEMMTSMLRAAVRREMEESRMQINVVSE